MPGPFRSRRASLARHRAASASSPARSARQRTGGAVRTAEIDIYRTVFEHVQDAVFVIDVEPGGTCRYRFINPAYTALTGLSQEAMAGRTPGEVFPGALGDELCANYRRCVEAREPILYAETLAMPVGETRWMTQLVPLATPAGEVTRIVGIAREMTALMQATARHEQEREHLNAVLATLDDVVFSVSADLKTLHYVSPNARVLTGVDPHRFLGGERVRSSLYPDDAAKLSIKVRQLLTRGTLDTTFRLRVDDDWRSVHVRARLVRGPDGTPLRIDGLMSDETLRRRNAEDALRLRRQLDIVVNALDDVVWSIEPGTRRFNYLSQAAEAVLGLPCEQITLDSWLEATAFDDRALIRHSLAQLWRNGTVDVDFRIVNTRGELRWLRVRGRTVEDDRGRPLRADGLLQDVTERKGAEMALAAARDAAEAATRAKSSFLATISHEIRTPLNGILGVADLLLTTPLDEEQQDLATTLVHSGQHLLALLNDVLDFTKIEAGRPVLEAIPFDLGELVRSTMRTHEHAAQHRGVTLGLQVAGPPIPPLVGDPVRLRQILGNLLSNAVKFTSQGRIDVSVAMRRQMGTHALVGISVEDTGTGIDAATLRTLFQPFTQADSSTTRRYGGTGLGLAIVRRLAEAMGGHIHATSTPGDGSRFTVTLPLLLQTPTPDASHAPTPLAAGDAPPLCALVVDDNGVQRAVVVRLLERLGVAATGVTDEAAIDAQAMAAANVVLLDATGPHLAVLRTLRASGTPLYAVGLTPDASVGRHAAMISAGLDDALTTPVTPDALQKVLDRARVHLRDRAGHDD